MNNFGERRSNSSTWCDHLLINIPTVFRIHLWIRTLELSLWLKKNPKIPVIIITVLYQWLEPECAWIVMRLKGYLSTWVVSDLGEERGLVPEAGANGKCSNSQLKKGKALESMDESFSVLTHCAPMEERTWHVLGMYKTRYFHVLF